MISNNSLEKVNQEANIKELKSLSPTLVKSVSELRRFSNAANWENFIPQTAGRYQFLSSFEQQRSDPNWKYFEYEINEIGFRGPIPDVNSKNVTLWLGCSFTLGEGLDIDQCFYGMVTNELNLNSLNLGMCGFGHYQIAQLFHAATNIWSNIDRVIITWPNIHRVPYYTSQNHMWNIHPHMDHGNSKEFVNVHDSYWKYWSNQDTLHKFRDSVEKVFLISKLKNIPVIHGTWGGMDPAEIINFFTNDEVLNFGFNRTPMHYARDGGHPGVLQNRDYADLVIDRIKNVL